MMNIFYRKVRISDGFNVSKVVTLTQDKKEDKKRGKSPKEFVGVELQALFDED